MRLFTPDDFKELYYKIRQRGAGFVASKFNFYGFNRTKSAFNTGGSQTVNWWDVPEVRKRWNFLISGDKNKCYEDVLLQHFLNKEDMTMLSLGSGDCAHELYLAKNGNFKQITCIDIADKLLKEACSKSNSLGLKNMEFIRSSVYDITYTDNAYDVIFFNASLHHFKNLESFIGATLKKTLRQNGYIVINEYVGPNRLQFPAHQISAANKALQRIPKKYRKIYKTRLFKNRIYGPGYLRMYIADPSECIASSAIKPLLNQEYKKCIEKPYGGNLLQLVLKDIAHHFFDLNEEKKNILHTLFHNEDNYLKTHESDYLFAVYQKK